MSVANLNIVIGANVSQAVTGLNTVSTTMAKTATSGITLSKNSNTAAIALQNLGRVAQDAPFGFIAIQNNLNPLLESFQRLKAESGSNVTAFKSLLGSLTGPAGIGIALSFVSSALLIFTSRSHQAKQATDDFEKAQGNAYSNVQTQIAKLNSLVEVARSDVATKDQQTRALREINKLIPDNIGLLTSQNIKTAEGEKILRSYTDALVANSTVEVFAQRIGQIRLQQHDAYNKLLKDQANAQEAANKLFSVAPQFKDDNLALKRKQDFALGYLNLLEQTNNEIDSLAAAAQNAQRTALSLIPDPKEKLKKIADDFFLANTNIKNISKQFIGAIAVETGDSLAIIERALNKVGNIKTPGIDDFIHKLNETLDLKKVAQQMDDVGKITKSVASAFDSVFSSIANGENVFNAIGKSLKQLITKLVATVLEAAILSVILNAIFPGLGAAGGFSFGNLFSQLSGLPKFAAGGVVTRPTLALVGENGPERISPLGYEGEGRIQTIIVEGRIGHDAIYLSNKRGARQAGVIG